MRTVTANQIFRKIETETKQKLLLKCPGCDRSCSAKAVMSDKKSRDDVYRDVEHFLLITHLTCELCKRCFKVEECFDKNSLGKFGSNLNFLFTTINDRFTKARKQKQIDGEKYYHYSRSSMDSLHDVEFEDHSDSGIFVKPHGLWLSIETNDDRSWEGWCEHENFVLGAYKYEVFINMENVLRINNADKLKKFTAEYRQSVKQNSKRGEQLLDFVPLEGDIPIKEMFIIDWATVQDTYDGIIIAPYIHSCRNSLETLWYYGWDVATGCIWNASAMRISEEIQ